MKNIAVYPGSFDPVTNGHLDIIKRASRIFEKVYVAILVNSAKSPMFTEEERADMITRSVAAMGLKNVEVHIFSGLLVDFIAEKGANVIVKGLRAVSDFEYEFQMALMNHKLLREVETLFMMTSNKYSYLSSSIVKEVAKYGGNLSGLVPDDLIDEITERAMQMQKK